MNYTFWHNFLKKDEMERELEQRIPEILSAISFNTHQKLKYELTEGGVILFQGDSITDKDRDWNSVKYSSPQNLGSGYAFLASEILLKNYPEKKLKIFNKGISGDKVYQLFNRWETDCFAIKPDILSILIGVNDFGHTLNSVNKYKGSVAIFENDFRKLLNLTLERLPQIKLIIGEPFGLKGLKYITDDWYPEFDKYRAASLKIAEEFNTLFIPYQEIMDEAQKIAPASLWSEDGVHPTFNGHKLMAQAWLKASQLL